MADQVDASGLSNAIQIPSLSAGIRVDVPSVLNSLKDVMAAKSHAIDVQGEALQKNTQLQTDYITRENARTEATIQSYDNVVKASKLPGNLSKIIGIFDSSYNMNSQKAQIEANSVKGQADAARTKTLMEINQQAPALEQTKADLAEQGYKYQMAGVQLASQLTQLDQGTIELKIHAAELGIKLRQDDRDKIKFALDSMTAPQAGALLKQAKSGKGEWVGKEGFLENKIDEETKSDLAISSLRRAERRGNADEIEEAQKRAAALIPSTTATQMVQTALQKQDPFITFPGGAKLPTMIVAAAANKSQEAEAAILNHAMANTAFEVQNKMATTMTKLATLASADPRAGREYGVIAAARQNFDPSNPESLRNMGLLLDQSGKNADEIVKTAASTFKSPEAKAAIQQLATTGQPSVEGANAVVEESIGLPGQALSKYKEAWDVANQEIVQRLNQARLAPDFKDEKMAMNWMMMNKDRVQVSQIIKETLADTTVQSKMGAAVSSKLELGTIKATLSQLSQGSAPSGIFSQALTKYIGGEFNDEKGHLSYDLMQDYLEQNTVLTKGTVDYNQTLVDALRKRAADAVTGDDDPEKTIRDRFLETALYGTGAHHTLLEGLAARIYDNKIKVRAEKQKQLDADKSGATQNQAAQNMLRGMPQVPDDPNAVVGMMNLARKNAPSAAVRGKSADDMKQIYLGQ